MLAVPQADFSNEKRGDDATLALKSDAYSFHGSNSTNYHSNNNSVVSQHAAAGSAVSKGSRVFLAASDADFAAVKCIFSEQPNGQYKKQNNKRHRGYQ
jgi:beta-lactam-binding protein with PASTA domain